MAYNALVQYELDAPCESVDSRSSSSASDHHHQTHESPSPDSNSRSRSRRLDDAMEGVRTVSREGSVLRHPTPDLQSLQGAYVGNVERLEQSAARLSLSSNIGEELHKMKMEQRRSDSRHSSVLNSPSEVEEHHPSLNRQTSQGYGSHASNSIVGTNNVARSGGFSPAAYFASPRNSVRSAGTWSHQSSIKERSASYGTRLTLLSEPEQEGKPLDSPLSTRFVPVIPKPDPLANGLRIVNNGHFNLDDVAIPHTEPEEKEAAEQAGGSRVSTDTFRQANGLFTDFDGVHTGHQTQGQQDFTDFDGEHTAYQPQYPEDSPDNIHPNQRVSTYPPPASRPTSYMEPTPTDNMVYYPAPVPMMLNLPKRLSKLPAAPRRDKRRSELLGSLPKEARQSTPWLPDVLESADGRSSHDEGDESLPGGDTKRRTMADLPPQLRASMFFDQPAVRQEVKVQEESAVATLDSILDASAFAPVSAFTDHPIAGQIGAEVYGRAPVKPKANVTPAETDPSRKRRSSVNLLTKRNSSSNFPEQSRKRSSTTLLTKRESSSNLLEDTKKRNSLMSLGNVFGRRNSSAQALDTTEDYHEVEAAERHGEETPLQHDDDGEYGPTNFNDAEEETGEPEGEPFEQEQANGWIGQPTTLLAELQMRKQQQKQRNRTAATAFPNGMQSTLLQLDAVAQVQKQARKQKRTHLAWEDPEMNQPGANDEDDEDVPLGMLFPKRQMDAIERSHRFDEDRPLGLIAKREIEDNEPLSHRRARLRGEDPLADSERKNTMYTLDPFDFQDQPQPPPPQNGDAEGEDETLGQRIRRLKATQIPAQPRPVSGDFASEMMSQLGVPSDPPNAHPPPSKTPDGLEEETLAQRRKRLQAAANSPRPANGDSDSRPPLTIRRSMADILQAHPAAGAGPAAAVRTFSNEIKFAPAPKTRNTAWAINQTRQASTGQLPMASGIANGWVGGGGAAGGGGGYHPHPMVVQQGMGLGMSMGINASAEGDLRQRDMIDRWRQSVMYS